MLYQDRMETKRGVDSHQSIRGAVLLPDTQPEQGTAIPEVDFYSLQEINPDIMAWIYSPGTPVNYPVVQGRDNQFYVHRMFDRSYNRSGSIFLDYRNTPDFSDKNSVLYGHHMQTETMFSSLEGYKDQSYYESHPFIYLITKTQVYKVELLAGVVQRATELQLEFEDDEDFFHYVAVHKRNSTFISSVEPVQSDRLLTLFTCLYDFEDARYILIGRLVEATADDLLVNGQNPPGTQ